MRIKFKKLNAKRLTLNASPGFTLLELAVTITIFVLLTTAILIRNARFRTDLIVTNLAYEIALTVREAQVYGINVNAPTEDPYIYSYAHGVHFSPGTDRFDLFADRSDDKVFDPDDDGAAEDTFILREGNIIYKVCTVNLSNSVDCTVDPLDITFKRPDPEARIRGGYDRNTVLKTGVICIKSPQNVVRKIEVKSTGQISVLTDSALYSGCDS
jgi:prepilin-type N-terminal cleavage/methylation domain-containing protein